MAIPCGTVSVAGAELPAMCVRIDDTVGVQVRDARHWGKPFEVYHFVVATTGKKSDAVAHADNGLLVEINGDTVAHAEYEGVQRRMQDARLSDYVVLKFVPFALIRPFVDTSRNAVLPTPPPPVFELMDVPHDGNCFFYAAQQSVQYGRGQVSPESAAAQRAQLWQHFQAWWGKQSSGARAKVLAAYHNTYPAARRDAEITTKEYWLTPFKPATDYQVRVWSDVARIKVVVYTFYSKGSWLRLNKKQVVTLADLYELRKVNKTVIGANYSQTIYLLHVSDAEHAFEHYASLIPRPPVP